VRSNNFFIFIYYIIIDERAKLHYEKNKELIRQKQKEYYEKTKKEKI
jgi:hypothetical protein